MSGARLPVAVRVGGAFAFALAAALLVACGGGNGDAGEPPSSATARGTDGGGLGNPSEPPSASALAAEPLLREGCRERGGYCGMLTPGGQLTAAAWLDHDRMYLADLEGRIRLLNVETGELWTVRTGLSMPQGLAVFEGRLYVTDMGSVCEGLREEKERLEATGFEVLSPCNLALTVRISDVLLEHLGKHTARVLSYRIDREGNLDDEMVVLDRIIAIDREHSPNGLTTDGEYVYVSIGHPGAILEDYTAQLRDLALRHDLMGVIVRLDSSGNIEVHARGLRNVYGISVAPDGTIYGADNDAQDGLSTSGHLEELNALRKGEFYGYPLYGTNEAPPDANVSEPVAILQGATSIATYANEDGVYVSYTHIGEEVIQVIDRFDYRTFSPTRIYERQELFTAILEQDSLLYLVTLSGNIYVIDPDMAPVPFGMRLAIVELDRILNSQPLIAVDEYSVYLDNSRIIYIKKACMEEEKTFQLHISPVRIDALPQERREYGFANFDFGFSRYGWIDSDMCIAMRFLPAYDIEYLDTGQYIQMESDEEVTFIPVWTRKVYLPSASLLDEGIDRILASRPAISSEYNVYLDDSRIIYIKKSCTEEENSFLLHVKPVRIDDLPQQRREHGFDNLDFSFAEYGRVGNDICVAVRYLPDYDIASLTTGQYIVREVDGQSTFETVWAEDLSFQE